VTVLLVDSNNTVIQTTTTNSSGYYLFLVFPSVSYTIQIVLDKPSTNYYILGQTNPTILLAPNYTIDSKGAIGVPTPTYRTVETPVPVPLPASGLPSSGQPQGSNLTIDFGFFTKILVGSYVWLDNNRNGLQDSSEHGINGVKDSTLLVLS